MASGKADSTTDSAQLEPDVEVTEESPAVQRVAIEVPAARVDRLFERAYRELGRNARVRGFRRGKTPRSVLRRLYGAGLAEDLERELIGETLPDALEKALITPVSEPEIEAVTPQEGERFRYQVRVEVKPAIELGDWKGLAAQRPSDVVDEEDIDRALENLRERHATLAEEPADTPAAIGHWVTLNFEGRVGGKPFEGGSGKDATVELGAGQLLPEFDEQLVGARAGETRLVRIRFPDDYGQEDLAGQEAEFDARVTSLQRRDVPDLDDEFAKDLGDLEDLAALRAKIRAELEKIREREVKSTLRRTLLDSLIERTPFAVPPRLVEERLARRISMAEREMTERGLPVSLLQAQRARWNEEWRPAAERDVREAWLLQEVARVAELEVADDAVAERLRELAGEQEVDPAELQRAYEQAGVVEAIRAQLLEERAVEFLLAEATVEPLNERESG